MSPEQSYFDSIVVGAGFAGLSFLHELRKYGFSCKIFEVASSLGGVWHWNCYPGARVDSSYILYQFHQPELSYDFPWTERFPSWSELQAYFSYIDERHNFSRDIQFNTRVTAASFNSTNNQWKVSTSDGLTTHCRFLILCTGVASKVNRPQYPGMEKFGGEVYHTGDWVSDREVDFKNKRLAVIGTGSSGVQVIQELGPIVDHLTVFQRTPNLANPMQQKKRAEGAPFFGPADFPRIRAQFANSHTGLRLTPEGVNCVDVTEEERTAFFEKLFQEGGFFFWRLNYQDILFNHEANKHAYNFWQRKTAARINDPLKRELLAPEIPPHPFGTKRPSLEQSYFEVYNLPTVDLVDIRSNPITEITEKGIRLENGNEVDVDIIILATGFDSVTGGIYDIDIRNSVGKKLKDHWKDGIQTLVGMTTCEFPNIFFLNGPHGTAALSIAALVAKQQSDWLIQLLVWMRRAGKQAVEPKTDASEKWTAHVHEVWFDTLFPLADSWYQGSNIPGKKKEPLSYVGGNPLYVLALAEACANEYASFDFI